MNRQQRIEQLGIALPALPKPVGAYVPARKAGKLVFTSGQLPFKDGKLLACGKVPSEVSLEQARAAARQAALNALSAAAEAAGSVNNIAGIVRLNVFVNSSAGFAEQAKVADGASELLGEIFGPSGRHTRCAIGAAELPLGAAVELDLVVELL